MKSTPAYRTLTDKVVYQHRNKNFNMPDSLLKIISFVFTEEEAEIIRLPLNEPTDDWQRERLAGG